MVDLELDKLWGTYLGPKVDYHKFNGTYEWIRVSGRDFETYELMLICLQLSISPNKKLILKGEVVQQNKSENFHFLRYLP